MIPDNAFLIRWTFTNLTGVWSLAPRFRFLPFSALLAFMNSAIGYASSLIPLIAALSASYLVFFLFVRNYRRLTIGEMAIPATEVGVPKES